MVIAIPTFVGPLDNQASDLRLNMYGVASTTDLFLTLFNWVGFLIAISIATIAVALAGLGGLGFGISALRRWIFDQSRQFGGIYMGKLPYKGYHRFRSKKWNMEHMP